jgi:hypothetical protein
MHNLTFRETGFIERKKQDRKWIKLSWLGSGASLCLSQVSEALTDEGSWAFGMELGSQQQQRSSHLKASSLLLDAKRHAREVME